MSDFEFLSSGDKTIIIDSCRCYLTELEECLKGRLRSGIAADDIERKIEAVSDLLARLGEPC